jgi:choloylglycine hydrolase
MRIPPRFRVASLGVCLLLGSGTWQSAEACTGICLVATDGAVVAARTLEFGTDIHSDILFVPRGYSRVGSTPDGKPGARWKAKYASIGASGLGLPVIVDGLNEKGLYSGLFYFPDFAAYMPYSTAQAGKTLAPWELGSWMLENCATLEEVRAAIGKVVVANVVFQGWGMVPPVHYIVRDTSGKSLVVEYVGGTLHVYDAPLGVFTNSPGFDWQMTNLRNYVNFSTDNVPPVKLAGVTLAPLGQGSGMLGMPGDFTPPSRFVRAVAFSQSALPAPTGRDAVLQAFHILNNFDIPKGAAREVHKDAHGNIEADYTLWTSASDLKAKQFYFRTFQNSQIRMVDLASMKLDAPDLIRFPMTGEEVIKTVP